MSSDNRGGLRIVIVVFVICMLLLGMTETGRQLAYILDHIALFIAILLMIYGGSRGNMVQLVWGLFCFLAIAGSVQIKLPTALSLIVTIAGFFMGPFGRDDL